MQSRSNDTRSTRRAIRQAKAVGAAAAALSCALVLSGFVSYQRSAELQGIEAPPILLMFAGAGALAALVLTATGALMLFLEFDRVVAAQVLAVGGGYLIGVPIGVAVIVAGLGWLW